MSGAQSADEAIRAAHAAVTAELGEALELEQELRARIDRLTDLAKALSRQLDDEPDVPDAVRRAAETRVDAIWRVLDEAAAPISPTEVREMLAAEGRAENAKNVASALSYLASQGRAERTGPARWRALRSA